jgi:SAM-dependent methyltransferase
MAFSQVVCNYCGSASHTVLHVIRQSPDPRQPPAWRGSSEIPLVRCNQCDLVFLNPRYDDAKLTGHYQDPQMFKKTIDPEGRDRSIIAERSLRVKRASYDVDALKRVRPRGRLLDVGCGLGFFLEALGSNYDPIGLEWSRPAMEILRDHPYQVVEHRFPDHPFPAGYFDIVTFHNVLDHLPDPLEALRVSRKLLKPDGMLMLTIINYNGICSRLYGEGFRLLGPNHLYYFTPRTINLYLRQSGFRIKKIDYPYFGTDVARPLEHLGKILADWYALRVLRRKETRLSPPFYGNVMRIFADVI